MPRASGSNGSRKRAVTDTAPRLTDAAQATAAASGRGAAATAMHAGEPAAAQSVTARPAKMLRRSKHSDELTASDQVVYDWDRLSFELQCGLLSCLGAVDIVKMALVSRRWNAAVFLHLKVRIVLSFSDGPGGVVPAGLSDAVLYSLLGRCPRLRCIYGFHFSRLLQQDAEASGGNSGNSHYAGPDVSKDGRLTTAGVTRSLRQCPQLEGIEISDPSLLQAVTEALPKVRLLHGFRNRHGRLPLGEQSVLRLPPDVLTTSVELYAVTVSQLPSMRHVKRLHLQYVLFTRQLPFEGCSLPELESFSMKFCTAPEVDRNVHLIDLHGLHMELHGYRPLFEALASATELNSLELVAVPFPGGMLQQLVTTRRGSSGCFMNLRRIVFGNCANAVEDDLGVLVVSSGSRLEQLSVQQGLSRDSLLRALSVCRCVLPALTHLRLGYAEQRSVALGTQDTRDRRRRPIPFDIERDRTRSPCLLTDGGLTRTLASPMLPRLSSLTINESPHLIDVRTWTAPVKAQLTELTLSRCHSLRLEELEEAVELMTALRHLRLEHVFREPPKGCWHVGLTAGTGLGASAGPFGMTVGRTGARGATRQQASGATASRCEGVSVSPTVDMHSAAGSHRPCTCLRRPQDRYMTCQSVRYRMTQVHANTQVTSDELRCGSSSSGGGSSGSAASSSHATAGQQHSGGSSSSSGGASSSGNSSSSETSACGLCPRCDGVWRPPDTGRTRGCSSQPARALRSSTGVRRLLPVTAAAAAARVPAVHSGGDAGSRRSGLRRPQLSSHPVGTGALGRDWVEDSDISSSSSASSSNNSGGSSSSSNDTVATPASTTGTDEEDDEEPDWGPGWAPGWASEAEYNPGVASKGTGTSDPLPEPDEDIPLRVRSSSLVSLSLDHVGVTGIVVEGCPLLDNVSAFSCRVLSRFTVTDAATVVHGAPLSRVTIVDCPKLDSVAIVRWSLKQPPPKIGSSSEPPPDGQYSGAVLRVRVLESASSTTGWWQQNIPGAEGLSEQGCREPPPTAACADDDTTAYVIVEEHGPWSDARRRVRMEGVLCSLLQQPQPQQSPAGEASRSAHLTAARLSAPGGDHADAAAAAATAAKRIVHGRTRMRAAAQQRLRGRRQQWGHANVAVPKPASATDEDELGRDGLVDGEIRVRYTHNLRPCLVCGHQIDLWGAEDCTILKKRKRMMCSCDHPIAPASLRVVTCTYVYTPVCSEQCDCGR